MRMVLLSAMLALVSSPARATDPVAPPVPSAAPASTELFVELVVNGRPSDTLVKLIQSGERLLLAAETLRAAGVGVSGEAPIDLSVPQAFRATYDAAGQRLLLDVPPLLLPTRRISGLATARVPTSVDKGALLNYDLFVQSGGGTTVAMSGEARVFGRFGTLSTTGVVRSGFARRSGFLRYDTSYRRVFEDSATELASGDLITRTLPWTTAVRMGGVQLSRNFAVRPDIVTVPLPSFAGEASLPSGVDLFVNGFRQSTSDVEPGRFVLDNVPIVNGAGEARIVTTDAVGRQIATVIPFYVAPTLLRPGLTDFSVEAGMLRRGYGTRSFGYGRAAAMASARHGLTQTITVSGHAEAARGLMGAGAGVAWRLGLIGAMHASVSASDSASGRGTQVAAGYTYDGQRFSIGVEHLERSARFADLGSFDLRRLGASTRSDRIAGNMIVRGFGSVGLGLVDSRAGDGVRARLASASASLPISRKASAFAAIDYDVDRRRVGAQLRIVVPLGGASSAASAGIARDPAGRTRVSGAFARAVPSDGGLGYSVDAAFDDRARAVGQASAQWRGRFVDVEAGAATNGSARNLWAGVAGSIVLMDGRTFAATKLSDSFALVSTGAPGVPVSYENQRLGITDGRGHLFIPAVAAYHPARFSIEPTALPIGMVASDVEARAALRPGAGAVIRLPVRVMHSLTARLVDRFDKPLPPGTVAVIEQGGTTTVGYDGIVLVENPSDTPVLTVRQGASLCTARIDNLNRHGVLTDMGVVRCE